MTVEQLIARLRDLPPHRVVVIDHAEFKGSDWGWGDDDWSPVQAISEDQCAGPPVVVIR